jgi:hypothetical protein
MSEHLLMYEGQEYVTSHYVHGQYLVSDCYEGRYEDHGSFITYIQSIPAYKDLCQSTDIALVPWAKSKLWKSLWLECYRSTGYKYLTLLTTTAQEHIYQHVKDENSTWDLYNKCFQL